MVLNVQLFSLKQENIPDYIAFREKVIKRYSDSYNNFGCNYIGLYKPFRPERFNISEVYLWKTNTAEEAQNISASLPEVPDEIQKIEIESAKFKDDAQDSLNLWVEPITLTLNSRKLLSIDGKMLRICNFEPAPDKTTENLIEFENRISDTYTSHLNIIDWNYMGTFKTIGLNKKLWAEVEFVKGSTPEEAIQKEKEHGETPETLKIIEECRTFISKRNKDEMVWLLPLILSDYAKKGIMLGEVND
jgi:hypothetical protein